MRWRVTWRRVIFQYFGCGGDEHYCRSHDKKSCDFVIFMVRSNLITVPFLKRLDNLKFEKKNFLAAADCGYM